MENKSRYAALVVRFDLRYNTALVCYYVREDKMLLTLLTIPSMSSFEGCSDFGACMIALMKSVKG
jgi:hypothetical protein